MNKLITILCLLCGFAGTALHAQSEDEKIKEIFKLSGIDRTFDQMLPMLELQLENAGVDKEAKEILQSAINYAFNKDSLKSSCLKYYSSVYNKEKGDSLLTWLRSPLAKKFNDAGTETLTSESLKTAEEYIKNFNLLDTMNLRIKLSYRLEKAIGAGKLSMMILKNSMRSFFLALNPFLDENERMSEEQINIALDNYEFQMGDYAKRKMMINYLYYYRDISDDDYEKYIEFYESPLGKWETNISFEARNKIIKESFVKMVIRIKILMPDTEESIDPILDY